MSKAKAPEWLVNAAWKAVGEVMREYAKQDKGAVPELHVARISADAICQAIQGNFPKPTDEEMRALINRTLAFPKDHVPNPNFKWGFNIGVRWANESLFRSEPEVPEEMTDEEIESLPSMWRGLAKFAKLMRAAGINNLDEFHQRIRDIEAYKRGKASK